jgi:ABC-2 type transport system permease protein
MIRIAIKEFSSFLNALIAYMVMAVFLTAMGLLVWVFPDTSVLDYGYADMSTLFSLAPYIFIFLIPAITMRSLAEEKKSGTMELLLTKPITEWDIVVGKYLACFLLVLISVLPTIVYYFGIRSLGNPPGNIDTSGVVGSYIGLIFLGGIFCSIGLFASSITSNQIMAFIIAAFLCFLLFSGFHSAASLPTFTSMALFIKGLGIQYHYESLSRGLIDSRDVLYFISVTVLFLLVTKTVLSSRSW